jgi:hypothetical protein
MRNILLRVTHCTKKQRDILHPAAGHPADQSIALRKISFFEIKPQSPVTITKK